MMINSRLTRFSCNAIAVIGVSLLTISACSAQVESNTTQRVVPSSQAELTMSFSPLVKQAAPAVVNVYTTKIVKQTASPYANDPFFQRFFGNQMGGVPRERVESSLGSGVIVGGDGVIVTNNHVIEGADEFKVVLADRREFVAKLLIADARTDLAVLKIDTEGEVLPTLEITGTRDVEVGDLVLAIGNPFGVGQTVTTGIISAQARTDVGISDYAFFLQTDAAINPGNSGGALVDSQGRLVGVNTAIFSRSGGSNGIGFAIPSEMVKRVVDAAVNGGQIIRPWLGLKGQSVTAEIAKSMNLERPMGILITEIYPDGPAEKAKLKRGDLVTAIDGREVYDERGLKFLAATLAPGEQVTLDYLRAGVKKVVKLTLSPPPGATEAEMTLVEGNGNPFAGAEIADLSPALADELGRDPFASGVLVNRVIGRSLAGRFGLRPGDMIREVNGVPIKASADLLKIIKNSQGAGSQWSVTIERNGQRHTSNIRIQ